MKNIYEMYETNAELEAEGFWHYVNPKIAFKLARSGGANTAFQKAVEKKTRPHRRAIQNDEMDTELANELMREAFAETIVLGWKGVKGKDNKEIKWSVAQARKMLKELPDLFAELRDAAGQASNFRQTEMDDDLGN